MKKQMFGMMISSLRKEKRMTQLELAEKMGVTELMQIKTETNDNSGKNKIEETVDTALKAIGIAMGIAVTVLSILGELEANTAFVMLGIGLASVSIALLKG